MDGAAEIRGVERPRLNQVVRRVVGDEAAEVVEWEVETLTGGLGAVSAGVFRVSGTMRGGDGSDSAARGIGSAAGAVGAGAWSLVVKVVRPPAPGTPGEARAQDVSGQDYWRREPLVYRSGLLEDLPDGLRAPRCYEVEERADGSVWLWVEDVRDVYAAAGRRWPAERYVLAARHIGRFNGRNAAGRPLPTYPWLCADQLRSWCERFAPATRRAQDPAAWQHPLLAAALEDPVALGAEVARLIEERERFLGALAALPRTLCHQDYWRRNLMAVGRMGRDAADGGAEGGQTVAVDWAFVGPGPLGAEAGTLLAASMTFGELDAAAAQGIERDVFEAYVQGLRDSGWDGDVRAVRLGYAAETAVRWGTCPAWLGLVHDEKRHAWAERFIGRPMAELVACSVGMTRYALDLAEEARGLMREIVVSV